MSKNKELLKWLKRNKTELREFLDLSFKLENIFFKSLFVDWMISYKISYNDLNERQKHLSDELCRKTKEVDANVRWGIK